MPMVQFTLAIWWNTSKPISGYGSKNYEAVDAYLSAPTEQSAMTAQDCGVDIALPETKVTQRTRPGEWLEQSPLLVIIISLLAGAWLYDEFTSKPIITAISNLNTYNFLFVKAHI
jgi:short-chain fatty acids transporter